MFTNNQGNNPGDDFWYVDVTFDGGDSWMPLENTNVANNSWENKQFVLNEFSTVMTANVQFRFVAEDIYLTVPKRKKKTIKAVIEYEGPIEAPITKGDKLGILNIYIAGELNKKIDIISNEEIKKANIFSRLLKSFNYLVWGDV